MDANGTSSGRNVSRRRLIAWSTVALTSAGFIPHRALSAQFEFKCGTNTPPDLPTTIRIKQMWDAVEKESNGRIRTELYPNSQLGGDAAMLQQLRVGALAFNLVTSGTLATVVPPTEISFLGFAFKDADEGLRTMDGTLGSYLRAQIAAKDMYALRSFWDGGMAQIGSNTHPIRTPDDFRGFKVRVIQSKIQVDLFKTLGASPTPLDFSAVYTALQTKLVDGEAGNLVTLESAKFYEVNKYMSLTNHSWGGYWLVANGDAWKALPSDLQDIVERNNTKYALMGRQDNKTAEASVSAKLVNEGITLNSVDPSPFRQHLRPYYQEWAAAFGPTLWAMLESSVKRKMQ